LCHFNNVFATGGNSIVEVFENLTTSFWTTDTSLFSGHLGTFGPLLHLMLFFQYLLILTDISILHREWTHQCVNPHNSLCVSQFTNYEPKIYCSSLVNFYLTIKIRCLLCLADPRSTRLLLCFNVLFDSVYFTYLIVYYYFVILEA
jgi:hypothetical protein